MPNNLGEFKPISLVGCMYQVLPKIMFSKLKKVLNSVVD